MTLADSSVWIDYLNGVRAWHTDHLDALLQEEEVFMADLILAEILQGIRSERAYHRTKARLSDLPLVLLGAYEQAIAAAENYRRLRAAGVTVRKTIEVFIATACLTRGLTLLHHDRDFEAMEALLGLRVARPGS